MNGRLQRWQLLGRLLLTLAAVYGTWRAGLPAGLIGLVAVLVFWFHGLVMLPMFLALRWINRGEANDGAPPVSVARLLRAWWRELCVNEWVFGWSQPFAEHRLPDFVPAASSSPKRGVLLLHGYSCNRGMWNGWMRRLRAAGHPFIALSLEPAYGSIDAYADAIDAAIRRLAAATGQAPLVVAHSMGGLAARAWWRRSAGAVPIHGLVTLGTPHAGTLLARFAGTQNAREMRRASAWLADLATAESAELGSYVDSYHSDCDHIVTPAGSAVMAGSRAVFIAGIGHLALVFERQVFADVLARLQGDKQTIRPRP